ncbi:hypothetical protein B5M44_02255 [Shinella sumterensis]|uniref:LysR substrate-binding domain-containing protein n=1 Tax=Shinella sumterensis TaxID=1967501 RepID=UPI00106EE0FE|nr:LysR substrate-binding domain-containing protein [Shinella sumterensis]MCD1262497.1 LysR family transcriptional regulator [Shinella sumterensis]TFF00007.1 hypothetical protein B5M44_02255 [Shinella sumterensis]
MPRPHAEQCRDNGGRREQERIRATIRLRANTAAIADVLPALLIPWVAMHQQVDIDLQERQSHEIARSVAAGFADIGVLSDAAATDGLRRKPFTVSRLVMVSAQSHWLAKEKDVPFYKVADEYFMGLENGALQDHIDLQADRLAVKLRYRIRLRTFESICSAAAAGIGVAVVPETIARRCRRSHALAITPLVDSWAKRHLSVCIPASLDITPTTQDLFEHLAKA